MANMKQTVKLTLVFLLFLSMFASYRVYIEECKRMEAKRDLIELSKIKYGLFNVDEWKVLMADIIAVKIEELDLSDQNREAMRIKIEAFLTNVIDGLEERYFEERSNHISGWIESGVAKLTGTFKQLKKDIPVFTQQILDFLEEEENRNAIRTYLIDQLDAYADKTFSKTDYTQQNFILEKYGQTNVATTKANLVQQLQKTSLICRPYKLILVVIGALLVLFLVLVKQMGSTELLLILFTGCMFLIIGVFLPMIEIDARIFEMTFSLLGEEVSFVDQVLYYKSKSIIEVVELMLGQGRADLMAVGLLVLTFSVLFPLCKLISSGYFLFVPGKQSNRFIHFMVFKSGKWSMADVMVIAIFMSYIGFDGIISEQLKQLQTVAKNLDLLTTNNSNLLFGFYAFAMFVVLSLAISQKIQSLAPQISQPQE